jgi:agmatinase
MAEVRKIGIAKVVDRIHARVGDRLVFVTFDIDVVDPAFAPGTGTPEVGGLTSGEAMTLAGGLNGLNIVGFDLVEVLPEFDPADITALLAANIVYQFISIIAAGKKSKL